MNNNWLITSILLIASIFGYAQTADTLNLKQIQKAQEKKEMETLFQVNKGLGGYIGFNSKYTKINNEEALLMGAEINMVVGHSLNLGFEAYGLVNPVSSNNRFSDGTTSFLNMGYGGFHIEPVILSRKIVHVSFPITLGLGGIVETKKSYLDNDFYDDDFYDSDVLDTDFFTIAEPGAQVELNVFKWMRLGIGASYRFTGGVNLQSFNSSDLDGLSGNMTLRLGWF